MTTFAGQLRLANGTTVNYSGTAPAKATVRLGMCPVNSTSLADLQAMFARFPDIAAVRLFSDSGFIPWNSPILAAIPAGVHLVFSAKTRGLNWAQHFTSMPARWLDLVDGIYHHEPEQQDSGDPTPAQFKLEYERIGASLVGHPRAGRFRFGPCFTEFRARADGEAWFQNFGIVGTYPGVTRVGFDVYNTGYPQFTNYRTPAHMWQIPLTYADRVGQGVSIDEWGLARKNDPTGSICAPVLRQHFEAFRAHPRARTITWFNRGGCYLGDGPNDPDGRNPEYAVMATLINGG